MDQPANGPVFGGTGTSRLVNLLIHRFGCFDFLGYEKAPTSDVDQYKKEVQMGLYPREIEVADDDDDSDDESTPKEPVLPWTYSPATDPAFCMGLVNELLHLIIILVTVRSQEARSALRLLLFLSAHNIDRCYLC